MKKNKETYFIIESSKAVYVLKSEKRAVAKKAALELLLNEKVDYKVMQQISIEDHLQALSKKNKVIHMEE